MRRFVKLKALGLLLLLIVAAASVVPSFAKVMDREMPEWASFYDRTFNLGLDLQGGLHLEYSVSVDDAVKNKLDQIAAELETGFKEKKDVLVTVERKGLTRLDVIFPSPQDTDLATDDVMGATFGTLERMDDDPPNDNIIMLEMPEQVLADTRKQIVAAALDTVRNRVDAMGVAEPNIYPKNNSIVVELPGLSDTATELKAAVSEAGQQLATLAQDVGGADQVLVTPNDEDPGAVIVSIPGREAMVVLETTFGKAFDAESGELTDDRLGAPFVATPYKDPSTGELDPAKVDLAVTEEGREEILAESGEFRRLLRAIERAAVLTMHLVDDETPFKDTGKPYLQALFEAGYIEQGMGISVNREADYGRPEKGGVTVKEPFVYYAKDRETLDRFFNSLPKEWQLPASHKVVLGKVQMPPRRGAAPEMFWKTHVVRARADITGDRILNANVGSDNQTGLPNVSVKFDRIGADAFAAMSGENVGRKMAIVLDNEVMSDPIFNERIGGGNVVITLGSGPNIREEANDLVKVLKSGSLPARLTKEFEIRVGADLGKESVDRGFKAFLLGLSLVIVFMAIYYRRSGVVAVFALVMNMVLVLAAMALFQATLTLPGIAGVVLTIGMAVDANVIIFERVREYIREGYTARAAIEAGYDRAFTTILDSQLTTAIAGLVLWQYGSGPIRGFAITLLIGIATSIFTGVFATRVFFDLQANRRGFDKVKI